MIAMRINSQEHEHTRTDWRVDQFKHGLYSLHDLPADIRTKLQLFMARLSLVYGAVDLIVTKSGDYVFLEVNPGGQWKWLEDVTAVPITAEIASFIATGKPCNFGAS